MSAPNTVDVTEAIEQTRFGSFQVLIVTLCAWIALLDGFDTQSIAYVAPVIAEQWGIPMAGFGPIFGAGLAGLAVGAFILSPVADRFGRKGVILLSVLLFGVFALITARATSLNELLVYRFLTGLGLGGAMPNIIALTSEYAPKRVRAVLIAVMFCGFPLGSTVGGVVSAPLISAFGWQSVFILGGILPLLSLVALGIWLPESIRYLVARGVADGRIAHLLMRLNPTIPQQAGNRYVIHGPSAVGFPVTKLFQEGRAQMTTLLWVAFFDSQQAGDEANVELITGSVSRSGPDTPNATEPARLIRRGVGDIYPSVGARERSTGGGDGLSRETVRSAAPTRVEPGAVRSVCARPPAGASQRRCRAGARTCGRWRRNWARRSAAGRRRRPRAWRLRRRAWPRGPPTRVGAFRTGRR